MVDFQNMMDASASVQTLDPIEIFDQLPKSPRVSNLYHSQAEILGEWFEEKRGYKDVVIELNTGGGKTLVGLLIAMSTMRETEMGVLYLVENKQLADQVVAQGRELGMPVEGYAGRSSLSARFDNGDQILVAPYQALFNGKSVFGIQGSGDFQQVGGVVIDDAHASLESVRDVFGLRIPAGEEAALYKRILGECRAVFESLGLETTFHEFMAGVGGVTGDRVVEIPFWEWSESQSSFLRLIADECVRRQAFDDEFSNSLKFSWPLLANNLKYCQLIISRRAITVSALYPLVDLFPTFSEAKRRVFMSATIIDYGDMVRAYDLRRLTEDSIIAPNTPAGIGRRMILPLDSEVANSAVFQELIEEELREGHGVVRLVPRRGIEEGWCHLDIVEPLGHDDVAPMVEKLRTGECRQIVSFVNRYNGIDLPDDSCRVLVLRELPTGRNDVEELVAGYLSKSSVNSQRIAQRIEQGIGRGVRGGSDHCVVLLEGEGLLEWMERKRNRKQFSPALRAQLDMGDQAMGSIRDASDYCAAIMQDLTSEAGWTSYHFQMLSRAIKEVDVDNRFGPSFAAACAERRAFACWRDHGANAGVAKLEEKAASINDDDQYRGWALQLAARICFNGDGCSAAHAEELQREAHSANKVIPYYPFARKGNVPEWALSQARAVLDVIRGDSTGAAIIRGFDNATASLVEGAPYKSFEISLMKLGEYLGFESKRADKNGVGPDVCWVAPDGAAFVLEAKNEKKSKNRLTKREASQLRTSRDWLLGCRPQLDVFAVSVHPNNLAEVSASAGNLKALTLNRLDELKDGVRLLIEKAVDCLPGNDVGGLATHITENGFGGHEIAKQYLESFTLE